MTTETTPLYEIHTQEGEALLAAGDVAGALTAFENALATLQAHHDALKAEGEEEPLGLLAIAQMNVATVLIRQERYTEAEEHLNAALNEVVHKRGVDHPLFAYGLRQMANVLLKQQQFDEARDLLKWVVELGEKQLGANHLGLVKPLQALLEVVSQIDENNENPENSAFMAAITERIAQIENHPDRWRLFLTEGNRAYGDEDLFRAEVCFANALDVLRALPEAGTLEELARVCHNLASVLKRLGKFSQAEPLAKEALKLYERLYGDKNHQVKAPLRNLADILVESGQDKASKPLVKRLQKMEKGGRGFF